MITLGVIAAIGITYGLFTRRAERLRTSELLDDQTVDDNDRSWLLAQIRKHFSGTSLLYVAGNQSDGNEKRARANGAQYYVSKPVSLQRFSDVLRSFLQVEQVIG